MLSCKVMQGGVLLSIKETLLEYMDEERICLEQMFPTRLMNKPSLTVLAACPLVQPFSPCVPCLATKVTCDCCSSYENGSRMSSRIKGVLF